MSPLRRFVLLLSLTLAAAGACRAQEANAAAAEKVYTREEVTRPAVIVSVPRALVQLRKGKLLDRNGTVKVGVVLILRGSGQGRAGA